jgi:ribosomal protein S27AE
MVSPYPSSQKGGTLIAEDVTDRATHDLRLRSPDGYRPSWCPRCGHGVLHVHDYPERKLFAEPADPERPAAVVRVVRHECASCGATWRTLPAFLARHLWRSWAVVEAVTVGGPPPADQPEVPERTQRRWAARLGSAAALLVQMLATSAQAVLEKVASAVGLLATREELVIAHEAHTGAARGWRLATLAALVHRLLPGVRLM